MKKFELKIDQIAIACQAAAVQHELTSRGDWPARDIVTAIGRDANDRLIQNVADLRFNYERLPGIEFEVLRYIDGWNWHERELMMVHGRAWLSHQGMHCDEEAIYYWCDRFPILQQVVTVGHTNPKIRDSRRYHYVILDTDAWMGCELKLIRRLTVEQGVELAKKMELENVEIDGGKL